MPGLIVVRTNAELTEADRRAAAATEQSQPVMLELAAHIRKSFDSARAAKEQLIEPRMLTCMRQRMGEYEPSKLSAIKQQGGSEVWMHITETKCRAAESWLREILLAGGDDLPWDLVPTPQPSMPEADASRVQQQLIQHAVQVMRQTGAVPDQASLVEVRELMLEEARKQLKEEAEDAVKGMKRRMADQLAEGGWMEGFNDFITDLATYPNAFFKGPLVIKQRRMKWLGTQQGQWSPEAVDELAPAFKRCSPWDVYPEPEVSKIQDGYVVEKHRLSRIDLSRMRSVPGYSDQAIESVLIDHDRGWLNGWLSNDWQRKRLEGKDMSYPSPEPYFDALQYWGNVSGQMLLDWGLKPDEVPDPYEEYAIEAWLVGADVIKAIINPDPLGRKPYYTTGWVKSPGSLWYRALPEMITDVQDVCNAAARALVNNMGIASGPQVEVNIDRLPPGEPITQMYPWKIWQTTNSPFSSNDPAIRFNQPNPIAEALMGVFEKFSRLADEHSGVPSYVYGDTDVQGAGRTASGLSMLMGGAGKGIRQVISYIDQSVIVPMIGMLYDYNMRYDPDNSIKGDATPMARGTLNLTVKEQMNMRRIEFLRETMNPIDAEIVGKKGRAIVLREVAKGLELPYEKIVPSEEEMDAQEQALTASAQTSNQPPGMAGASQAPQGPAPSGRPAAATMDQGASI